ncbi:MAG: hypothetical protein AAF614_12815 [Chloroflexota bacterium]
MTSNWRNSLPNYDQASYYAGITAAFAEIVAAGVKHLALSPPYTEAEFNMMLEPTRQIAAAHGVLVQVEDDLLVTTLFPADIAAGKYVVLLAQNEQVLATYQTLKEQAKSGNLSPNSTTELAWAFGRLLSYSDERIAAMLAQ